MENLVEMKCEACRVGAPRVKVEDLPGLLAQIPEWSLVDNEGIEKLQRKFKFPNFSVALIFTTKVGNMADEEGHHPSILTEWGQTTVVWWTHKIHGIHTNDFISAAKTDEIFRGKRNQKY